MASKLQKALKFSGRISPQDQLHQYWLTAGPAPDSYIPPTNVQVTLQTNPPTTIQVPQYSATLNGSSPVAYAPSTDCNGYFTSCNFQANNNCYAYACDIAANSFPQPGRYSGYLLQGSDFTTTADSLGSLIQSYAAYDGLIYVGQQYSDLATFSQGTSWNPNGHFVGLMVSLAWGNNWPGDYHWSRCDNSGTGSGQNSSWSQKDGGDQVTNFDFAGQPITDPATANWTVNQGPLQDGEDLVVSYQFYCYMFVPPMNVNII